MPGYLVSLDIVTTVPYEDLFPCSLAFHLWTKTGEAPVVLKFFSLERSFEKVHVDWLDPGYPTYIYRFSDPKVEFFG